MTVTGTARRLVIVSFCKPSTAKAAANEPLLKLRFAD